MECTMNLFQLTDCFATLIVHYTMYNKVSR